MTGKHSLAKSERLKSRKSIDHLFEKGTGFHLFPFKVLYAYASEPALKAGAGVSSRHFKKATDRNRIKRLTKEAWRLQKNPLREILLAQNKGLHVFLLYTGKELPLYATVSEAVTRILQKLEKEIAKRQ